MVEAAKIVLNELPEKMGDLGSITLPFHFGNLMTTRALADSGPKSKLTLRVGDDSVTLGIDQENKQTRPSEDKISSIYLDDGLLEKELALWYENNSKQFTFSLEEDFDDQRDLRELEKLLEESDANEDLSSFEETNSTCLDKNLQYDESNQHDKKESLEDDKAWNNKNHNSSIGLHMIDQRVKEVNPTTIKRTKPRALVSTTFEFFTFKPPDSQAYEESEVESVTSSDDKMMTEREIKIEKWKWRRWDNKKKKIRHGL
uniref:Uncharacterized protein n=1 Tax=Lactuca sativa TaxID=4236 RepID=A0A9R1UT81_LACSA|nr:hypothetical protein LSAT_V11C800414670 [Lactuca sativa]